MTERAVWKFVLPVPDGTGLTWALMPGDAVVLSTAAQGGEVVVWAIVGLPADRQYTRRFRVVGTGHRFYPAGAEYRFIGTALMDGGLVWHVWEETPVDGYG